MQKFAVFTVPSAVPCLSEPVTYVEGTAAECAAALLPALSQPERLRLALTALEGLPLSLLSGVEFEQALRRVKRAVGVREAAERAKALVRGTAVHHAIDGAVVPPESFDLTGDDDEPLEPTPLEAAGPK